MRMLFVMPHLGHCKNDSDEDDKDHSEPFIQKAIVDMENVVSGPKEDTLEHICTCIDWEHKLGYQSPSLSRKSVFACIHFSVNKPLLCDPHGLPKCIILVNAGGKSLIGKILQISLSRPST